MDVASLFEPIGLAKAIVLIVGYGLIGGGIKFVDQAFDEHFYDKRLALFVSVLLGAIIAAFIAFDNSSAIILISIIVGVAISGKLDNYGYYVGVFALLSGYAVLSNLFRPVSFDWTLVAVLVPSAFIDEIGEALASRRVLSGALKLFFEKRLFMKLVMLVLVLFGAFHWVYLFSFLFFDLAYDAVEKYLPLFLPRGVVLR